MQQEIFFLVWWNRHLQHMIHMMQLFSKNTDRRRIRIQFFPWKEHVQVFPPIKNIFRFWWHHEKTIVPDVKKTTQFFHGKNQGLHRESKEVNTNFEALSSDFQRLELWPSVPLSGGFSSRETDELTTANQGTFWKLGGAYLLNGFYKHIYIYI